MKKFLFPTILLIFCTVNLSGQSSQDLVEKHLKQSAEDYQLTAVDMDDWVITSEHVSTTSGVRHIYFRQRHEGIEVFGANASIHVKPDGELLIMHNQFIPSVEERISSSTPALSALQAVESVARELNYSITEPLQIKDEKRNAEQQVIFSKGGISLVDIPVKLMYQPDKDGNLRLSWNMSISEITGSDWWNICADAQSGKILNKNNWVVHCEFGNGETIEEHFRHSGEHVYHEEAKSNDVLVGNSSNAFMSGDQYRVYALPDESPQHGSMVRTLVTDPADATASPFGWHDTNGAAGAEFTITRGNNVFAYDDIADVDAPGTSPDGLAALHFDFPIDFSMAPVVSLDAATTNLFYWSNIIHDIVYQYGFDESCGNFQENNYGNGGSGSDSVNAESQDGESNCNANFGTPPDGSNPRMQMFLCDNTSPDRDGSFDNLVIVHEYAHGISNRLTGGGGDTDCLDNDEQMGEGWSDWYGLMLTMQAGDQSTTNRDVGTYLFGQAPGGGGIRARFYTTDMSVNEFTYDRIKVTGTSPHALGHVWATMLWDLTWALIDVYGFDPDFYFGNGGNNIAMALVTEGMKLQPCSPGFVDGRDAILAADQVLYDGANKCLIWEVFTRRGLGWSADQGDTDDRTDGTEAFDYNPSCCALNISCSNITDVTVPCDENIPAANTAQVIILDACGEATVTSADVTAGGNGCPVGSPLPPGTGATVITRTYTAMDENGGEAECVQEITVISNNGPYVIECAPPTDVECIDDYDPANFTATFWVECGTATVTPPIIPLGGLVPTSGTANCPNAEYEVTWKGTDECGRMATCTQEININNSGDPVFTCPANLTVDCAEDITPLISDVTGVMTTCGVGFNVTVNGPTIIDPGCDGDIFYYEYTVTDACGRSSQCTRSYTIDNDGPTITAPDDYNIDCDFNINVDPDSAMVVFACPDLETDATVSGPEVNGEPNCPGTTYTYIYSVTDLCGRTDTSEQHITIDNPDPIIDAPADQEVECDFDIMTDITMADVTVSCDLAYEVEVTPLDTLGPENCPGTKYRFTYKVTDACGRMDTDIQVFTIGDNDPPTIDVVDALTVDCFESINPNTDWAEVTTACNNGVDYTVTASEPALIDNFGFNCPNTSYRVIFTVEDACERIDTAHQVFTIQNDGPTMDCPDNCEVLSCYDGDYNAIITAWINTVTATSSCADDLTVYNDFDDVNGTCIFNGITPVRFWAWDDCNRIVECNSLIIIADNDAPYVYIQPEDKLVPCTATTQEIYDAWIDENGGAAAVDACGGPVYWEAFPNQVLDCDGGPQLIEVDFVVEDNCGNKATVSATFTTKLLPNAVNVAGLIQTEAAEAVSSVQVAAYQSSGMMEMDISSETGDYAFEELPYEDNTVIVPNRDDDYLNGLTTYDLILLQMHILGVQELNSPYKRIAADANRSGSISTLDLVLLRRLILHIDEELEDNTSWRFVDADYVFPNPQNPFLEDFPEVYSLTGLEEELADFIAVKIGDLNLDAQTNSFSPSEDRSSLEVLKVQTEDQFLRAGQAYEIPLSAANFEAMNGFQFTLNFDQSAIEVLDIQSADLIDFSTANYGMSKVNEGAVTISWNKNEAQSLAKEDMLFSVVLRAQSNVYLSEALAISSVYTKAEAYRNVELMNVDLTFLESGLAKAHKHFKLFQNQPNPFMDATTIGFILPEAGEVTLEVYTAAGKMVHFERNDFAKGYQQIDLDRSQLPIGVLYYKVSTKDRSDAKRMLLLE